MTHKDMALELAARIDQIDRELQLIWHNENLNASHEAGVTLAILRSASRHLQKVANLCTGADGNKEPLFVDKKDK